jgi:hypothetical protein
MVFGGCPRRCTILFQECLFVFEQQVHVAGATGLSPRFGGFDAQCPYQAMA